MICLDIVICPRDREDRRDDLVKKVQWPVVPSVGHKLDLCKPGFAGGPTAVVIEVKHWFGAGDIDVFCNLEDEKDWDSLLEEGWTTH